MTTTARATSLAMPAGVLGIVLTLAIVHTRIAAIPYTLEGSRLLWTIGYAAALSIAAYAVGLPDVFDRARQLAAASVVAVIAGMVLISLAQLSFGVALMPRFVVFGAALPTVVWFSVCNLAIRHGRHRARTRDRVLIVGEGEDVDDVESALRNSPERPAEVVGILAPDQAAGTPGGAQPLLEASFATGATVVVLDRVAQADGHVVDQTARLHEGGVRIRTLSLFYEYWLGRLPVGELERVSLMFDIGEVHRARFARRKRLIDVMIALLTLPALAAAVPFVVVGNLVGNRGPLLFRQTRVGKSGVPFEILKFRTMRGEGSSDWTASDDDRVTPFGRFLRRTHIDELPQVVNVLRGELSMVGPRPEQPHYVEQLAEKLPFYELRHLVQPGLTGWAQVNQGYAASTGEALEKLQYEFWYLRHQRLAVDIRILARTVRSVIGGDGR